MSEVVSPGAGEQSARPDDLDIDPIQRQQVAPADNTPDSLLSAAVAAGQPVEVLERLLDLKERYDAEASRRAFHEAMTSAQQKMPLIVAKSRNDHTKSLYAKLDAINAAITPVYTSCGFSLSFGEAESTKEGHLRFVCTVRHSAGHAEDYYLDLPRDDAGSGGTVNKTPIHAAGSTASYGRRYLTMMIFNLAVGDDNDAQGLGKGVMEEQSRALAKCIAQASSLRKHRVTVILMWQTFAARIDDPEADLSEAAEAWFEIPEEERMDLWLAITKGGLFRNDERNIISNQFRRAHFGDVGE